MQNLGIVTSVSDFLIKTEGVHYHTKEETRFFCRGQDSMNLKLRPKIGRYAYTAPAMSKEEPEWLRNFNSMFSQFEREYVVHHPDILSRKIDRLSLAQHYGLATQLLDWTLNPLISLYFACETQQSENGIVFIFSPFAWKNICDDSDLDVNISYQIFRPSRIDQRMINQDAVFTFHQDPTLDFANELGDSMNGVIIPASSKQIILNQLSSIGINKAFIYPGLESVCTQIDSIYREKYTYEENIEFWKKSKAYPNEKFCLDERDSYLSLEDAPEPKE